MTARRRRALASAVGALAVALICAALSANVHGTQHTLLLGLTVAWLVIAASCVGNAVRTAHPADAGATTDEAPRDDATSTDDPG
jgi:hypothetical protein